MDTDKAYLLGLMIGGGVFGNAEDVFSIRLPYKKWGSFLENPQRAGEIAGDILRKVGQMFRAVYGLSVQYETTPGGTWIILCEGDITEVKKDLMHYGISCEGELRGNVDLRRIATDLVDDNLKRRFIAGLADTIGSMAKSQRRFTSEHQIISFEMKGFCFQFVCDLCQLLYSINVLRIKSAGIIPICIAPMIHIIHGGRRGLSCEFYWINMPSLAHLRFAPRQKHPMKTENCKTKPMWHKAVRPGRCVLHHPQYIRRRMKFVCRSRFAVDTISIQNMFVQ